VSTYLLGNDVVDLDDPDSQDILENTRFLERVFADTEREALAATSDVHAHRFAWTLWAAKEAAYKALLPVRPELIWSPRTFVVADGAASEKGNAEHAGGEVVSGLVRHADGDLLAFSVHGTQAYLHVICVGRVASPGSCVPPAPREAGIIHACETIPEGRDESTAVRELAITLFARLHGTGPLQITGEIPRFVQDGRPVEAPLSLSHHGRYHAAVFLASS
jgi:phosphopantetheine--protein transferase-like protein